jgi:oxygen-independent coproporphyrinogen-3 oxidase
MQHSRAGSEAESAPRDDDTSRAVRSVYVHVPYCRRVCPYCDFAVHALHRSGPDFDSYLDGLAIELRIRNLGGNPRTLYLGGGTPSSIPPRLWPRLRAILDEAFDLSRLVEFTVEVNPEDFDDDLADALKSAGATRLSFGAQSFTASTLKRLGRRHGATQVVAAIERARARGFAAVGIDLILAAPDPDRDLEGDLRRVVELAPEHVSGYVMTYEPGTKFTRAASRGRLQPLGEEAELAGLRRTAEVLEGAGYLRYEVSNFARPGHRSRHNLGYWRGLPHLGIGPSAVSARDGRRERNARNLDDWYARLRAGRSPVDEIDVPDARGRFLEALMLGLRIPSGLRLPRLQRLHGERLDWLDRDAAAAAVAGGLLIDRQHALRPTARGLELADELAVRLLRDEDPARRQP